MAALRGISQRFLNIISHSNPHNSQFFSRAFTSKLFVKGISFSSTEKALAEAFSKFGEVVEVTIVMNKAKNRPKGYAYVTFAKEDEAQKALMNMNGKLIDGRVVFVDSARPSMHRRTIESPEQADN